MAKKEDFAFNRLKFPPTMHKFAITTIRIHNPVEFAVKLAIQLSRK
jgi:hypothetical protein